MLPSSGQSCKNSTAAQLQEQRAAGALTQISHIEACVVLECDKPISQLVLLFHIMNFSNIAQMQFVYFINKINLQPLLRGNELHALMLP